MPDQHPAKLNSIDIGIAMFFLVLLVFWGMSRAHFKETPQEIMIGFSGLLLILKFLREEKISTVMFYLLLGFLAYHILFWIAGFIMGFLNPNDGWVEVEGGRRRVMQMNWVWGGMAGIILAPLTVRKYHKLNRRNILFEQIFVAGFLVITTVKYILH